MVNLTFKEKELILSLLDAELMSLRKKHLYNFFALEEYKAKNNYSAVKNFEEVVKRGKDKMDLCSNLISKIENEERK